MQLVESARSNDFTDLLLVTETRGEPGTTVCISSRCLHSNNNVYAVH